VNLTDAESQIRDADFAAETAALTRAQILVQSGTVVLQIANQNPQNVLTLLRSAERKVPIVNYYSGRYIR
jgi:flagellin